MVAKKSPKNLDKPLAENRKARSKYEILETWEAGIALRGHEVKSIRQRQISLAEAWVGFENGELYLKQAHITQYKFSHDKKYDPTQIRKLLMHKTELERIFSKIQQKGLTLLPLKVYDKKGKIKLLIGLGRGLATHDKRKRLQDRDQKRDIERQLKRFS